jgi:hypothetical protein
MYPTLTYHQNTNPNFLWGFGSKGHVGGVYSYSFNTQMHTDEISGTGNHTTALFWEYDTRLGRRWNLDPKPQVFISDYAVLGNNPIWYNDPIGDTIRLSDRLKNDADNMKSYNLWAKSRAGKRFHKRYGVGGKYENVLVEFDVDDIGTPEGITETFSKNKKTGFEKSIISSESYDKLKAKGTDMSKYATGVESGDYLAFRIKLNSSFNPKSFKQVRERALTIVHETQHLRIEHYSLLMYNRRVYSSSQQHYMMRTNLNKGSTYKGYKLPANKIYDFNAERWQFIDEHRLKGETNEQIESQIGGFVNW